MTDGQGDGPARTVAVLATAGAAIVHLAAVPVHLEDDTTHGVAFVVMAVALGAAAALAWLHRGRAGLVAVAVVNGAVLALWWTSRTVGLPGEGVETVGVTDAMAVALEAAAVAAALAGLRLGSRAARVVAPLAVLAVVAMAVVPAVARAGDHDHDGAHDDGVHDDGGHEDEAAAVDAELLSRSISSLFAAAPHTHDHSGGTGNAVFQSTAEACVPTEADVAAADDLITRTTFALLRFADPDTAVAAGYRPLGFEPNGVHHYLHEGYRGDGRTLDPERPESILYGRTPDGGLFPVGVMFMMEAQGAEGPEVGGCLTPWHTHGPPFAPPGRQSVEMMHVWTVPVPGGAFAEHVEGEYARLYLGASPVDADRAFEIRTPATSDAPPAPAVDGEASSQQAPGAAPAVTATTSPPRPVGIVEVLNALNVHRELLCSDGIRPRLEASLRPEVVDRICDPLLNGPLPGATAPPASELAALFTDALGG